MLGGGQIRTETFSGTFSSPTVLLRINSPSDLVLCVLAATNERGRSLLPPDDRHLYSVSAGDAEPWIGLPTLAGARRVNVKLGIYQMREAELLVKP